VNWIADIIRNKRIQKYNEQARGVEAYQSIAVAALFPYDYATGRLIQTIIT
jgi:hypothetical protein